MTEPPAPTSIEVQNAARKVAVTWDDGHESVYDFVYLRGFCPCAECQGHAKGWTFIARANPVVSEVSEVGSYAVNIVWDEGQGRPHTTGIYAFETLRALCPCSTCVAAGGPRHPVHLMAEAQRT
ncbi:MAG: DUF971 domain-containing protein [Deltaproteobacteria bacterium]|nr:DUF971 domain-containing protein [Deltaproteobacteria bacterium]